MICLYFDDNLASDAKTDLFYYLYEVSAYGYEGMMCDFVDKRLYKHLLSKYSQEWNALEYIGEHIQSALVAFQIAQSCYGGNCPHPLEEPGAFKAWMIAMCAQCVLASCETAAACWYDEDLRVGDYINAQLLEDLEYAGCVSTDIAF